VHALKDYVGEVVLVGINYDKKTKKHECVIERFAANVAHDVAHERQAKIRQYLRINPTITRMEIAEKYVSFGKKK